MSGFTVYLLRHRLTGPLNQTETHTLANLLLPQTLQDISLAQIDFFSSSVVFFDKLGVDFVDLNLLYASLTIISALSACLAAYSVQLPS